MTASNKNYLELCNDILSELYFEEFDSIAEMKQVEEGKRVQKEINRALTTICNKQRGAWAFRDKEEVIVPIEGVKTYKKPNGFINYLKYPKNDLVLSYYDSHKYLTSDTTGQPVAYWMDGEKIRLYPTPDRTYNDDMIKVSYLTYDYAIDCCGFGKPVMECDTDTPIIPNQHRDILVWKVCSDWRANLGDAKTQFYKEAYKEAYRNMLSDCRQTYDLGNGLHLGGSEPSFTDSVIDAFNMKYYTSEGNM